MNGQAESSACSGPRGDQRSISNGAQSAASTAGAKVPLPATYTGHGPRASFAKTLTIIGWPSMSCSSFPGKRVAEPPAKSKIASAMTPRVVFGEIRDDDVGAGSHERRQGLVDGTIAIEPAVADCRL